MIGYTKVDKRLKSLQVSSGHLRFTASAVSGMLVLWRPGFMSVTQGGQTVSKPYPPYHCYRNLKRGMHRPLVWGCPAEMTDFVEKLVFQLLDIDRPKVRQIE
jgi:hypothetical protein